MDPVRDMMLTGDNHLNHLNEVISLEEGMDCRELNSRFFSLLNHESKLNIIISKTSSLISCKLGGHEIIVDQRVYRQKHETWAISDRPFQKINSLPWNCHVRGAELILSTSNNSSSIMYELTRENQLNSIVKLKSIHLQSQVTYFNLKNARQKVSIDGHTLIVQCNGDTNRIQAQPTKLLCSCNKKSTILPQSFIGNIPCQLVQHYSTQIRDSSNDNHNNYATDDDMIVCDTIFSLEATCPLDVLKVQLKYANKTLIVETRSNQSGLSNGSYSTNASTSVSSSSSNNANKISKTQNTNDASKTHHSNMTSNHNPRELQTTDQRTELIQPAMIDAPLTNPIVSGSTSSSSSKITATQNNNNIVKTSKSTPARSHPTTILRIRVRVTNFGICIMPIMMTNYTCSYQFVW